MVPSVINPIHPHAKRPPLTPISFRRLSLLGSYIACRGGAGLAREGMLMGNGFTRVVCPPLSTAKCSQSIGILRPDQPYPESCYSDPDMKTNEVCCPHAVEKFRCQGQMLKDSDSAKELPEKSHPEHPDALP